MRTFRETMRRLGVDVVTVNGAEVGREGPLVIGFHNYYFTVDGPVPLVIAEALYATPVGRTDIRAKGDCTCPHPATRATYYDADGAELVTDPGGRQEAQWDDFVARGRLVGERRPHFVPDAKAAAARAVVESFHVDSELGMHLLLQALRAEKATTEDNIERWRRGA